MRRPYRGAGDGRRGAAAGHERDGRQHGRQQPRHGAGLSGRPALRLRRSRRADLPGPRPAARRGLSGRLYCLRRGCLGRIGKTRRVTDEYGEGRRVAAGEATWFGQPRGLTILILTNMWETFSYYGMRALLVYYMTRTLLIGQENSSFIYGAYTAFAYFTPIIGGTIADRWLGKRQAVTIGAGVMAAGPFMMAFQPAFYFA